MNSLQRVWTAGTDKLWLPGGGTVDLHIRSVQRALSEYDENLILGRHEQTGDWCVFLNHNPMSGNRGEPFPVLGLGKELPHADDVILKVRKHDTLRHGKQMLAEINKHNDNIQGVYKAAGDEASAVVAEGMESFLHGMGKTPYMRSYRPLKQTAVRR